MWLRTTSDRKLWRAVIYLLKVHAMQKKQQDVVVLVAYHYDWDTHIDEEGVIFILNSCLLYGLQMRSVKSGFLSCIHLTEQSKRINK